jgi:hypothetical protein
MPSNSNAAPPTRFPYRTDDCAKERKNAFVPFQGVKTQSDIRNVTGSVRNQQPLGNRNRT